MQGKKVKKEKMNFKDYYKSLSELQLELRSRVIERFNISEKTFYNRLNEDSWSPSEIKDISAIKAELTKEISELC